MSFLFFLSYLRWGNGLESLISIKGGAQQERFVGGAQQISQRLAERFAPRVVLDCPVREIEQSADGVIVRGERGACRARLAIVALPPVLAGRIHYSAALPARRDQITARMPMGSVIKYVAVYERPFWRAAGFSGEVVSDTGITVTTFDDCVGRRAARGPGYVQRWRRRAQLLRLVARGAPQVGVGRVRAVFRSRGRAAGCLRRKKLERRSLESWLLRGRGRSGRADRFRLGPARAVRPDPLVGHRDGHRMDGIPRRRDTIGAAGRQRSAGALAITGG